MGHVIFGGLFEPGTSVTLYQVASDAHLTPEQGFVVGRRLADEHGSVGFDGLELGARVIARGFDPNGILHNLRDVVHAEDDANAVAAQPPIRNTPQTRGLDNVPVVEPVPGAPFAILQTGVPEPLAA